MSQFVESLRRLFQSGTVALFKIQDLKTRGVITDEEYQFITESERK